MEQTKNVYHGILYLDFVLGWANYGWFVCWHAHAVLQPEAPQFDGREDMHAYVPMNC